jgi:hypothetical protein
MDGNHGQLCCGENAIVMEQLCCGAREKFDPGVLAQLSCSVKFGRPLKSLTPNGLVLPDCGLNDNDKPDSGTPDTLLLVSVRTCAVGTDPTCWAGKVIKAGVSKIG